MISVDKELCSGCGVCPDVCSYGAISLVGDTAQVDLDKCTLCGTCAENCPADAITIEREETGSAAELDQWRGVWVFAEFRNGEYAPVVFELLGKGRELADALGEELCAVAIGSGSRDQAEVLGNAGADRVLVADSPELEGFSEDVWARILSRLASEQKPEVILAGATSMGRAFLPQVATMLETGLTADCTQLEIRAEDRALLQTRPAFGGNLLATIVCPNHRPQMATVRPNVFRAPSMDFEDSGNSGRQIEIDEIELSPEDLKSGVRVVERKVEDLQGPDLANSQVIVTAGRGIGSEDNLKALEQLANCLEGAVGATRAITDAGWISHHHQIGQTGATVAPKLYLGFGVSGAIQHLVGMQGSEIIVAVNKDPDAPIFDVATYGIVGDVHEILQLLLQRICKGAGQTGG